MKSNYNYMDMPDAETLKRYWGSAEAYLEEQRRTASCNMEANQFAANLNSSGNSLLNTSVAIKVGKAAKNSLHLPFSLKNSRHA